MVVVVVGCVLRCALNREAYRVPYPWAYFSTVAMTVSSEERMIATLHALVVELSCHRERRQGLPSSQGSCTSEISIF